MFTYRSAGREALKRLGGKEKVVAAAKGGNSGFPEDKIVIPVGVTPQTLKNYTLYDMLGFSGEWGAAADAEGTLLLSFLFVDCLECW